MTRLGTNLPEHLIGRDKGALSEFLKGLEGLGFDYITVGDHVLGADTSVRPDWKPFAGKAPLYDIDMVWHEPLVLFGYLAALTESLQLCTGILISPQRQTVLLAKQAAEVDVLTGGRLRFVISAGWNDVEYEALGVDFRKRGKIMDEQFVLMRKLWTNPVVSYNGHHHTVTAAGINPLPVQGEIPLFIGGQSKAALRRAGRLSDGWVPYYPYFHEDQIRAESLTIATLQPSQLREIPSRPGGMTSRIDAADPNTVRRSGTCTVSMASAARIESGSTRTSTGAVTATRPALTTPATPRGRSGAGRQQTPHPVQRIHVLYRPSRRLRPTGRRRMTMNSNPNHGSIRHPL